MNVVEILVTAKDLTGPAMASVNAKVNSAGSGMRAFHKTALLAGAGLAAVGVESVKMAAKFDSSMALLHTQAGVAKDQMGVLKKGVLDLAGKVGQDPDSLAESLFHVESNFESMGISSQKALKLTETAAKGATVGHADLVDVTNALTAAVASGIPGVQNFDKAMGVLNATVGVGDMKMQDLANAFGSGMVATVKGFGLSIQDVGAALAVFGDNNIRGSLAGNQLRMSVMALGKPVSTAKDALDKLGLKTDTLAKDMQKGGLKLALEDLVGRMKAAGISSKEQGQIITDAFGRKAGAGLNILVSQFDRLESKYPALAEGANKFGSAWADTQKTFAFQMKSLQSSFDALMISIGTKLIPPLQSFVSLLLEHKGATVAATAALAGLLAATVAVSVAMKAAAAAQVLWAAGGRALAGLKGVFESVALRAMYMREAFVVAGGGVAGLRAAFASLGAVAKASVVVGGLALLALAVAKIADLGKSAPPDIDKLTTSLKGLSSSGKFSGELQKTFGDMDGLVAKVKELGQKSEQMSQHPFGFKIPGLDDLADKIKGSIHNITDGKDSLDSLKGDFNSLDQAMAGMAQNGYAQVAAKDFDQMRDALKGAGYSTKDINALFPQYTAALAGLKSEQEVTAQSMGLFGDAAVATQKKLDGEAQSAKGLEQSIMALNAVHRGAYDAETAFYQAMSDAQKAVKENGRTLNLNSDAGRKNRDVLSQLAAKTEDLVDKKNKEHVAWDQVDKTYQKGRKSLIDAAMAMGDTRAQATKLADELLKAPKAKAVQVKLEKKAAEADLNAFNAALKRSPGSRSVTLKTLSSTAEQVLEGFGFKVQHLKNGSVRITAATGGALAGIRNVAGAIASLHDKTVSITSIHNIITRSQTYRSVHDIVGATGGLYTGKQFRYADGGLVQGPGTGTSDDVPAPWLSNGEFVIKASAVKKYGEGFLQRINDGDYEGPKYARGGKVTKAQQRAKAQAQAEAQARHDAWSQLTISHFGQMAGYKRSEFGSALGKPQDLGSLVNALNQWRGIIQKATHGRTESRLLKQLDSAGKSLLKWEKQLTSVTANLSKAKDKLASLKDAAAQLRDSVKGNLLSSANITRGAGPDSTVTLSSIRSGMRISKDKVTAFAAALKQLKAKGFSKSIIQQVAEAGIDGGGLETAGALLQASASEVKSINQTQADIEKAAGRAGKTTADAVYEKAIKAQEKYVKKLEEQQKKLKDSMDRLAKAMEKAIEKAFHHGKKASGGIVGAAASGGLRSSLTWVGEQGPELLDLPAGARVWSNPDSRRKLAQGQAPWASMLTAPRRAPAAVAAGMAPAAGDGGPLVIQVRIGERDFGELWVDTGRKEVRARGSLEATLRPPRGR
ncbi:phage tail tape measure protein [Streptomyces sp. BK340]|uniref:phage tail tape measure protein n=1 Tax=Streptomyces sp. BK340 TaxID=2572903 RepID=UPI0011AA8BE2|nr:phage tail tape measure protein [Streptomyces sp. BK340]TVZ96526.1 TP901 family phage tail tape measure protein [Streptomyces sp. BK340]